MDKRYLRLLSLLVLVIACAACQRSKPVQVAIEVPGLATTSELQFELAQAPAQAAERIEGQSLIVTQDNCSGAGPLESIHRATVDLGPAHDLGAAEGVPDLQPYDSLIGELLLRRYQIAAENRAEGQVALRTSARSKGEFVLRWDETWDRNTLNVVRGGQVLGAVPVRVRLGMQLVVVSSREEPCISPTPGTPNRVDLPIVGSVPLTATATLAAPTSPEAAAEAQPAGKPETPIASAAGAFRPTRIARPSDVAAPGLKAAPTDTATPGRRPTRTLRPTRTPRPTWTSRPARVSRSTRTVWPTITPRPSRTPVPSRQATPLPTSTATRQPLAAPTAARSMEPSATPDPSQPRPGSTEALALVRDYIQFLQAQRWRDAYNLLDETYQQRISYNSFVKGYEGVNSIELYGLESTWVDEQHDAVRALMTIRTVAGSADWMGTYEVVRAPGQLPYERRIRHSSVTRLPPDPEPVG